MKEKLKQQSTVFKALSDERRLRILSLLKGGEKCACVLIEEMDMPQSSLSYHMKILCESGIVSGREEGKWTHYRIDSEGSRKALQLLSEITTVTEYEDCCDCKSEVV